MPRKGSSRPCVAGAPGEHVRKALPVVEGVPGEVVLPLARVDKRARRVGATLALAPEIVLF